MTSSAMDNVAGMSLHAGVELAHMAQFEQPAAERLGQRLPVILPVPQLRQPGHYCREVIRIAGLQLVQKFLHGARPRGCLVETLR